MPTMVMSRAFGPAPTRSRWPTGSAPAQYRRAIVSSMTATGSAFSSSCSVKKRPRTSGACSVSKEAEERAQEQTGADEQDDRQRELRCDQYLPEPARRAILSGAAAAVANGRHEILLHDVQGGGEAEEQARRDRDHEGKQQHRDV